MEIKAKKPQEVQEPSKSLKEGDFFEPIDASKLLRWRRSPPSGSCQSSPTHLGLPCLDLAFFELEA